MPAVDASVTADLAQLRRWLGNLSSTIERLDALEALHFSTATVAEAIGVSLQTIRDWRNKGVKPRPDAREALDDLRAVALLLIEGGLDPAEIEPWFVSKTRFDESGAVARPYERIASDPEAVFAAAEAELRKLNRVEAAILRNSHAEKVLPIPPGEPPVPEVDEQKSDANRATAHGTREAGRERK